MLRLTPIVRERKISCVPYEGKFVKVEKFWGAKKVLNYNLSSGSSDMVSNCLATDSRATEARTSRCRTSRAIDSRATDSRSRCTLQARRWCSKKFPMSSSEESLSASLQKYKFRIQWGINYGVTENPRDRCDQTELKIALWNVDKQLMKNLWFYSIRICRIRCVFSPAHID